MKIFCTTPLFSRTRSHVALAALAGSIASVGCASAPEDAEESKRSTSEAIVGGYTDTLDTQVVAVLSPSGLCTGIAISATKVLTAAHCVDVSPYAVTRDLTTSGASHAYAVQSAVRDPAYSGATGDGHDLGVLTLSEALPGTPLATNLYGDLPLGIHGSIRVPVGPNRPYERIVGFGRTSATGSSGTRLAAAVDIANYGPATLDLAAGGSAACFGDSGGPILWDTTGNGGAIMVIGVSSFGDSGCTVSSYTRVNVYASYLRALYADALGRTPDSSGLHNGVDAMLGGASAENMALTFATSPEYQTRELNRLSNAWFGHSADTATTHQLVGQSDRNVRFGLVTSSEYFTRHGATSTTYIQALYTDVLGRSASSSDLSVWNAVFGQSGSFAVAAGVVDSDEAHRVQISSLYPRYLHRAADTGGVNDWAQSMGAGTTFETVTSRIAGSAESWNHALVTFP